MKKLTFIILHWFMMFVLHAEEITKEWNISERFYGFRYEIQCKNLVSNILHQIQTKAHVFGCFGWIQNKSDNDGSNSNDEVSDVQIYVGEARCPKQQGLEFQSFLSDFCNSSTPNKFMVFFLNFKHF
jgi:hypothetical protein